MFIPGEVVRLNSGGPSITVMHCDHKSVRCSYFSDDKLMHCDLLPSMIMTAEPPGCSGPSHEAGGNAVIKQGKAEWTQTGAEIKSKV